MVFSSKNVNYLPVLKVFEFRVTQISTSFGKLGRAAESGAASPLGSDRWPQ